ncbi:MAG: GNAT family N-acetyltransferase [Blastocatellia bacterium]|nr:GNAT family N-acetyltransferase [Blastocatellia bacterium]
MEIQCRWMTDEEALTVSEMVIASFDAATAPLFSTEAVEKIHQFAQPEAILQRNQTGHRVLVAQLNHRIAGMIQFTENHIRMLFVAPDLQRVGIGRTLLQKAFEWFESQELRPAVITLNSSPNAVEAYRRFGFIQTKPEQDDQGIRYIPMEFPLSQPR